MPNTQRDFSEAKHPWIYGAAYGWAERREAKIRDFKVRNAEILPPIGQAALIGFSHREASDARTASIAVADRASYLTAKDELWTLKYFYAGYALQLLNAFPINRERLGPSTIKRCRELIKNGMILSAFEEGTRFELNQDGSYKLDEDGKKIVRGDKLGELKQLLPYLSVNHNTPIYSAGISHLTPSEVSQFGRDVKRIVLKGPDLPNPELSTREAIAELADRHALTMQSAFDEAQDWARTDAPQIAFAGEIAKL